MDWSQINDAPKFDQCVNGKTIEAKVVDVYDGDSIKAIFPLNGTLYKWTCRLGGVDTPELRTSNAAEKAMGYKVRDVLREQIMDQVVSLQCGELDKYGRLLVTVYKNDICMNDWLIENKYAFAYDGGTKKSWATYLENQSM